MKYLNLYENIEKILELEPLSPEHENKKEIISQLSCSIESKYFSDCLVDAKIFAKDFSDAKFIQFFYKLTFHILYSKEHIGKRTSYQKHIIQWVYMSSLILEDVFRFEMEDDFKVELAEIRRLIEKMIVQEVKEPQLEYERVFESMTHKIHSELAKRGLRKTQDGVGPSE